MVDGWFVFSAGEIPSLADLRQEQPPPPPDGQPRDEERNNRNNLDVITFSEEVQFNDDAQQKNESQEEFDDAFFSLDISAASDYLSNSRIEWPFSFGASSS